MNLNDIKASIPAPGDSPIERLRHIVAVYEDVPDREIITGTYNVYGEGVSTGLSLNDLRVLVKMIDACPYECTHPWVSVPE